MQKKPTIKKIVLTIGGKDLELSLDEAKELRDILHDTFPESSTERTIIPYWPYWYWWTEKRPNCDTITWTSTGSNWKVSYNDSVYSLAQI